MAYDIMTGAGDFFTGLWAGLNQQFIGPAGEMIAYSGVKKPPAALPPPGPYSPAGVIEPNYAGLPSIAGSVQNWTTFYTQQDIANVTDTQAKTNWLLIAGAIVVGIIVLKR